MSEVQSPQPLEGERGIPSIGEATTSTSASRKLVFVAVLVAVLVLIFMYSWRAQKENEPESQPESYERQTTAKTFSTPTKKPPVLEPLTTPTPLSTTPLKESDLLLVEEPKKTKTSSRSGSGGARVRPLVFDKGSSPLMVGVESAASAVPSVDEYVASLSSGGSASVGRSESSVSASFLGNRNFILTKGSFIECVLETRLDSTVPGNTSCIVSKNVYSDDGKVLLIERGSTISGEYQSNVQQGQARIFVLWTRLQTPNGIVVSLDSQGTDSLGGAGVPGRVNSHFFARFGAAFLLSLVDDVAGAAVATLGQGGGQVFNFGATAGAAQSGVAEVIQNTINIKPTLTKNQGEIVGVYVAHDLDFSGVYRVVSK